MWRGKGKGGYNMGSFIIISIVAGVFVLIGRAAWNQKDEAGFYSFAKPPKMKDVKAYNHAVAKIWFVFAGVLEILGILSLFIRQNSPVAFVIAGADVGAAMGKCYRGSCS